MELTTKQRELALAEEIDHEGHAQTCLTLYGDTFRHNDAFGWLRYNGRFWEREGAQAAVERAVTNTLRIRRVLFAEIERDTAVRACKGSRQNVNGTRDQLRKCAEIQAPVSWFDANPDLVNAANGVIDLRTGELCPHRPDQYFTYALPVAYDPKAAPADWLGFLDSLGLPPAVTDWLQLAAGYSMTGHTSEEIMFYLYGPPRSGKGTFTETLNAMLGQLGGGTSFRTFTAERRGDTSNFDLAPLRHKRFITAAESSRWRSLNTAVIKQITGGDEIQCSFKHKDHFHYAPQYKIWLTSNWPINADVDDDAAWGRLRVVTFSRSFVGQEDKGLKLRLRQPAALAGVLAWVVSGAVRWYKLGISGLHVPQEMAAELDRQRHEQDSIGQFIKERCRAIPDIFTPGSDLYHKYKIFCENEDFKPKSRKMFTQALDAKGYKSTITKYKGKTTRGYNGIEYMAEMGEIDL